MIRHNTELTKFGHDFRQLMLSKNILFAGEKLNPNLRPHQRLDQRLDLRLRPKLRLRLRLGITPTGTGTGTLIMVMAIGATMAIALLITADITMANRFEEFQSLIFEKSYETIEHWREIWT
jgi:hypothetical protein